MRHSTGGRACAAVLAVLQCACAIEHPEEFVNLLAGSFTDGRSFSTGNTLPLVGMPWGFNHWAPQTKEQNRRTDSWWFDGNSHDFTWIRCTHQPSPWIGDWGWFLFTPMIGDSFERNPKMYWEPRAARIKPHIFDATLAPHGVRLELVPTMHAAAVRATFPSDTSRGARRICFKEMSFTGNDRNPSRIKGKNTRVSIDRMMVSNFGLYVVAESITNGATVESHDDMMCFRYDSSVDIVEIRIATSLINEQQALTNLHSEAGPDITFQQIALIAKLTWNKLLKRVDVVSPGEVSEQTNRHLGVFYTGLARALTFPRRLDEVDSTGRVLHWSPYDPSGRTHPGVLLTDNGFWDTFRTVYPMLGLLYPDLLGEIVQGWLNSFMEGGWLPTWASPGYRNCMVGTFADVVVADAIMKDIPGFDVSTAIEAIRKDSFEAPPRHAGGAVGKDGIDQYIANGYIAQQGGGGETASRTLDFAYADKAVSKAFTKLAKDGIDGDTSRSDSLKRDAATLDVRSERGLRSLFNAQYGLMVPRGGMRFDPLTWGNGFAEGNSWHHSFPAWSIGSLAQLHGGRGNLLQKLHKMLTIPSTFGVGSYGQVIHEMSEFRALSMGQYGHNNQPSHHILYLFAMLGEPQVTHQTVRTVMDRAYGHEFYAGDEDNGEMGAWFVMSALGIFAAQPGSSDTYVLGSPIFKHVAIERSKDTKKISNINTIVKNIRDRVLSGESTLASEGDVEYLDVIAPATGPDAKTVEAVAVDGTKLPATTWEISHDTLMAPRVIQFVMNPVQQADESGFNTSPNNGVFSNFLDSLTKKLETSASTEELLTKDSLSKLQKNKNVDADLNAVHMTYMAEKAKIEEDNAIAINTLKMELQNANSKLKSALELNVKATAGSAAAAPGPGNGILNHLAPVENGPTARPESHLAGAVHFLKNKYESNHMRLPHQNDDILGTTKDTNTVEDSVDCDHSKDSVSFYETFGFLSFMSICFLSVITAISLFGRFYSGKHNPGFLDGLFHGGTSSSGPVLVGRAGLGNHKKDIAHVV